MFRAASLVLSVSSVLGLALSVLPVQRQERLLARNVHADACIAIDGVITDRGCLLVLEHTVLSDGPACTKVVGLTDSEGRLVEDKLGELRLSKVILPAFQAARRLEAGMAIATFTGRLSRYQEGTIVLVGDRVEVRVEKSLGLDEVTITSTGERYDREVVERAVRDFCRSTKSPSLLANLPDGQLNVWSAGTWTQEL